MLYTRTGTPGSGKSYNTVQMIIKYLKKGRIVITNLPLNYDVMSKLTKINNNELMQRLLILDNEEITPRYLFTFYNLNSEHCTVELIIDEAADIFNSRTWNDKDRPDWLKFFRMHRHMYYNVCLVTQSRKDLDKQIQGLFDIDYQYLKPSEFGVIGFLLSIISRPFGKLGGCREVYIPSRGTAHFEWFFMHPKIYAAYDSFTMNNYRNDFMIDDYEIPSKVVPRPFIDAKVPDVEIKFRLPGLSEELWADYLSNYANSKKN